MSLTCVRRIERRQLQSKPFGMRRLNTGQTSTATLAPVLDLNALEPRKVFHVHRDEDQVIHQCDGGNLTVSIAAGSGSRRS